MKAAWTRLRAAWAGIRSRKGLSLVLDSALIIAVFLAVHAWQTRDLPIDELAPDTRLALLDGSGLADAVRPGEAGIVYFFAPWCIYCKTSIDNLDGLVDSGSIAWGTAVALDYGDAAEVAEFVEETGVALPVLMGHGETATDWSVPGFPTYFVIDAEGRIVSRSVGYSTWLGMRLRTWKASL